MVAWEHRIGLCFGAMDASDSTEQREGGQVGVGCVLLVEGVGTRLFFTTNPGLEGVVEAEWRARLQAVGINIIKVVKKPFGHGGQVLVESEGECAVLEGIALQMRSVHHVQMPICEFELPEGDELGRIERELAVLALAPLREAGCFRGDDQTQWPTRIYQHRRAAGGGGGARAAL